METYKQKFTRLQSEIFSLFCFKAGEKLSQRTIAKFLKVSWNTAEKYLLELALDNKIQRIKKQGVNLWMLK